MYAPVPAPMVNMVLLTMTTVAVEAIEARKKLSQPEITALDEEPSLEVPQVDKPISHAQVVRLWKDLKDHEGSKYTLESLLRGSNVYVPPPPPKPEPTEEYKALMARLRREDEERNYRRMVSNVHRPSTKEDEGDDDVTYNDVHRQVMLVINFLVTIIGCAATLWILARWWNAPARLFLTLGGSLVVGVAEVGVYYAYVWHLGEAKRRDGRVRDVHKVVDTWVVGQEQPPEDVRSMLSKGIDIKETSVRLRKVKLHKNNLEEEIMKS